MSVELILGDCLDVMRGMPDKSVDAIITDLPYGTTACSWDNIIPFEPMWKQVEHINKGVFVTTASQPFTSALIMSNIKNFKYEWIWDKVKPSGHLNAKIMPLLQCETISIFGNGKINYFPQGLEYGNFNNNRLNRGSKKDTTYRNQSKIISISTARNYPKNLLRFSKTNDVERVHPTQKPVALYSYLIQTYTNEGDTVLDITMGSGTTGVACVQLNRNFIGIEIDEGYYKIAEKRIHDAQQQPGLFERANNAE